MQISDEQVELVPCPFCGGEPKWWQDGSATLFCTCLAGPHIESPSRAKSAEIWNHRAALSLPVQPVAWIERPPLPPGKSYGETPQAQLKRHVVDILIKAPDSQEYGVTADKIIATCLRALTAPPVPPTKGPEDDLIAAAQAFVDKLELCHADPEYQSVWMTSHIHRGAYAGPQYTVELDKLKSALLALRSRPASALPVVGEDGAK